MTVKTLRDSMVRFRIFKELSNEVLARATETYNNTNGGTTTNAAGFYWNDHLVALRVNETTFAVFPVFVEFVQKMEASTLGARLRVRKKRNK